MLRSIGKTCFAYAYTWTDACRVFPRQGNGPSPFIVCYHRVVEDFNRSMSLTIPSMLISTRMLEQQIDWMAKRFSLVSLDDIGKQLESGRPSQKPMAAITFDDGYGDVYHHAFPLLKRKGIPAAFFVVTGNVDTGQLQVFDRLYLRLQLLRQQEKPLRTAVGRALRAAGADAMNLQRLEASGDEPFGLMTTVLNAFPQEHVEAAISVLDEQTPFKRDIAEEMAPLNWDMVETMHRGGMTIGSHTKSHLLLTAENIETARRELFESKAVLESHLNAPVKHFAYPDGRFNSAVTEAVKDAGYRFAYSICDSRDKERPLLTIPRKVLWERACLNAFGNFSSAVMNCQVYSAFEMGRRCEHNHAVPHEVIHGTIC